MIWPPLQTNVKPLRYERECLNCGKSFKASTLAARFCSGKCRQEDYRSRKRHGIKTRIASKPA